jgi:hypothetical protein
MYNIIKQNYVQMREGWAKWGNNIWLALEKYGEVSMSEQCSLYEKWVWVNSVVFMRSEYEWTV